MQRWLLPWIERPMHWLVGVPDLPDQDLRLNQERFETNSRPIQGIVKTNARSLRDQ